jgi:hypothetical protein
VSNTGYGQDRLYGAIDDDDDFIEEWRSSWEPAAHTSIDEVIEPLTVAGGDNEDVEATPAAETSAAASEADLAWGSWQSAPPMAAEPETLTEVLAGMSSGEGSEALDTEVDESGAEETPADAAEAHATEGEEDVPEPLVAPDDATDPDLVDWEPEPAAAPVAEPEAEGIFAEEADHSLGLTGAAAAALAAASAWGVWGGTASVPSMPAPSPFPVVEPEPETPAEPEPVTAQGFEPEEPGLYVPEPEVLSIPEPQALGHEPEAESLAPDLVTGPIPEPDMYAAPGRSPFQVPEPEPHIIPEPEPTSEPSPFAPPTGDTTPIPEPGFTPQAAPDTAADESAVDETAGEQTASSDAVSAVLSVPPERAAQEQVHAAASASAAYDLRVDVFSVLGFPVPEEPAAPADEPSKEEPRVDEHLTDEQGQHESEHGRWFERARMWAANNLYDPDEDVPARSEGDGPDEQHT